MMGAQQLRFCQTTDGVRIAYSTLGTGPPLVFCGRWAYSLDYRDRSETTGLLRDIGTERSVLWFDRRGIGSSQRNIGEVSLEAGLLDLDAVVAANRLDRFDLIGDHDGAHIVLEYAARNPRQVRRLVLLGLARHLSAVYDPAAMRGLAELAGESWQLARMTMAGWVLRGGQTEFLPWLIDILNRTVSPEVAQKYMLWSCQLDATKALAAVSCPALCVHQRDDTQVGLSEATSAVALMAHARLVTVESPAPAWRGGTAYTKPILAFLREGDLPERPAGLTEREVEILSFVAAGHSNQEIATLLSISARTAERHIQNIYLKTGTHNRAEITAFAVRNRIPPPQYPS